jgi:hypothetical protein
VSERLSRGAIALAAVVVIVWSAVLLRDSLIGEAAADRLFNNPGMSAAEWERSMDDMRAAELLDPSDDWTVRRASYLRLRDRRAALRLLEPIVERQPDYLEAWVAIANAARGFDDRAFERARTEIVRLDPPHD